MSDWGRVCARTQEDGTFEMAAFCFLEDYHIILVSFSSLYSSIWASGGREAGNLVAAFVTDRYPFTERWLLLCQICT